MKRLHLVLLSVWIVLCTVYFLLMHYLHIPSFWLTMFTGLVWIPLTAFLNRKK